MLRDLVSREQVENRRNFPKNNYFCYRWRVKDNFNRSIDRQMFHLSVHGADNHKSLMSHKVLQLHKSRFTGNRKDLVVNLANDALEFLEKRRSEHNLNSKEQVVYSTAMTDMVELCFNLLLSCATELNTILGLSELFITATEPNFEVKDKTKETVCSYTQCRFSTSMFSLVMEGRREKINFYIVPSDELMSIEEVGLTYESVARWKAHMNNLGEVHWKNRGVELNDDILEVTAIELLSQLIEKTKERLSPVVDKEAQAEEFPLLEDDPWQKDMQQGYKNSSKEVQTATSTSIQAISAEEELQYVGYPNHHEPALQTLEIDVPPQVIESKIQTESEPNTDQKFEWESTQTAASPEETKASEPVQSEEIEEQTAPQKSSRARKRKLSRKKRKKRNRK